MIISAFGSSGCPRAEEHKDSASFGAMQQTLEQLRKCEAHIRCVTMMLEMKREALKTLQDELEVERAAFSRLMNEKVHLLKVLAQSHEVKTCRSSSASRCRIRLRRLSKRKTTLKEARDNVSSLLCKVGIKR